MKVNFWQALGLVLVVIGVILFARKKMGTSDTTPPAGSRPAVTAPATQPATDPAP